MGRPSSVITPGANRRADRLHGVSPCAREQQQLQQLFGQLKKWAGLQLDRVSFCAYADQVQSCDELVSLLLSDSRLSGAQQSRAYCTLFELWRCLLPRRKSLEMLCIDLDEAICAYESGVDVDQKLEELFAAAIELVDAHSCSAQEAQELFQTLCQRCAHDLQMFIYDFIIDQIEAGACRYAQDLYWRFQAVVSEPLWFDLLKVRWSNSHEAEPILQRIYDSLQQACDLELLLEILCYLSEREVGSSFGKFFALAVDQPLQEAHKLELQELLNRYLDHLGEQSKIRQELLTTIQRRLDT